MDPVKKDRNNVFTLFGIFVLIAITYKACEYRDYKLALRDSSIVIGEIERFEYTKGATVVDVQFFYNGRLLHSSFGTYQTDSLKLKEKIRLRVSKKNPKGYIEYMGVVNN